MTQSFVTVAVPFAATHSQQVKAYLDTLGNPAKDPLRRLIDATNIVHFMSTPSLRIQAPTVRISS